MSILLDTSVLLWWLAGAPLSPDAVARIADPANLVLVSAASVWEIAIKRALGKVRLRGSVVGHATSAGFELLAISAEHAERAGALPHHHRDPFDRMLVAQAQAERLVVATRDSAFRAYQVPVLPC